MSEKPISNPLISAFDLSRRINEDALRIFDCRFSLDDAESGRKAFLKSHIPGAQYLHLDEDLSGPMSSPQLGRHPLPNLPSFWSQMQKKGVSRRTQVVCYDASGGPFAARLWWLLTWMGHTKVSVLDGGWKAWVDGRHPLEEAFALPSNGPENALGYDPERHALTKLAKPAESGKMEVDPNMRTQAEQIVTDLRAVTVGEFNVIDSRARTRFLGEEEPIDPVAGHIPGAQNLPWAENLSPTGEFKTAAELRARFATVYEPENQHPIFYCGSGVSACHNILATQIAGFPMPKLYAESWSGWISDPSRPIATGE